MDGVESIGMPVPPAPRDGQPWTSTDIRGGRWPDVSGKTSQSPELAGEALRHDEQAKQVGKDFESVLLTKLFEQVQSSIQDSGFDEEDGGSQQVRGMFWLYLARDVADKGGFGLWKDIYQHIRQMEGTADPAGSIDEEL